MYLLYIDTSVMCDLSPYVSAAGAQFDAVGRTSGRAVERLFAGLRSVVDRRHVDAGAL